MAKNAKNQNENIALKLELSKNVKKLEDKKVMSDENKKEIIRLREELAK